MTGLARLRSLLEHATPGPWVYRGERLDRHIIQGEPPHTIVADPCVFNPQDEPLIVALRNCADELLAVAEATRSLHGGLTSKQDPMDVDERIERTGATLAALDRKLAENE